MRLKRVGLISLVVASLFVTSGLAAASEHEDTTFNYGYDPENRLLLINTIAWGEDAEATDPPCQFDTDLTDDAGTEHEVTYTFGDPIAVEPLELDGGAEICEVQAAEVSGPNGQVNHGMIMKAFKALNDGARRGCLNRSLAQSDFGKGDQQVLTSDPTADPEFEASMSPALVDFFTALADCDHGEKEDTESETEAQGNGNGKGKGKGKGRPDSPGKSASAPGRAGK